MKGYEIIAKAMSEAGVDTLFGVAGDANLFIIDDLIRTHGIRYVATAHEAAAVMAAIGYARSRGTLGFTTTTHGPGMTNTVTALTEAVRSGTSIVYFAGDTDPADPLHPQTIDQRRLVESTGAAFEPLRGLATAAHDVGRAVWRAQTERRPVVLDIPAQFQQAEGEWRDSPQSWPVRQAVGPDADALDDALGMVATARRPLVLAGRGAIGAEKQLLALAERLGAPVATSLLGSSLFAGAPFDLGLFGTLSRPVTAEVLPDIDCVVSFGASLNGYTTDQGRLLNGKRLVQCDLAPEALGRYQTPDVAVVGDAGVTAAAMVAALDSVDHRPATFCTDDLRDRLAAGRALPGSPSDRPADALVDGRALVAALDQVIPSERTVVLDVGLFMLTALTLPVPSPTALVTTHGFQSIGLGMGAAVGAGVAHPNRPLVFLAGDGGFMMGGLAELHTAIHAGLDLVCVIFNNHSYGAEHIQFYVRGLDATTSRHEWPDLAAVARAMGAEGVTVRSNADLEAMSAAIANRRGPILIDAHVDPDEQSALALS